tara:strand:+ start:153 stop:416 length:264 start_codon:yes stop_codon:yes gene_type:complete
MSRTDQLRLSDLVNKPAFEKWLKANIGIYNNKDIPMDHISLFLEYIEEAITRPDFPHDRAIWLKVMRNVKQGLETEVRMEGEDEYAE